MVIKHKIKIKPVGIEDVETVRQKFQDIRLTVGRKYAYTLADVSY